MAGSGRAWLDFPTRGSAPFGVCPEPAHGRRAGVEILTFIEGHVPPDLATWSDEQLVRATELIRYFHDATAGAVLAGEEEVVCHNDLSPCNTVFVKGMPSAFIDFDEAAPGSRSQDLGYAVRLFLDLGAESVDIHTKGGEYA